MGDFIDNVDDRTQFAILCAIRNLSDAAANESSLGPLIINLIHVVATGEESISACAAGILSNLTCNNIRNKQTLCFNRSVYFICNIYSLLFYIKLLIAFGKNVIV